MLRALLVAALLLPSASWACGAMSKIDCQRIANLVSDRMQAITLSFGDLAPIMPQNMEVRFMRRGSPEYDRYKGDATYDPEQHTLFLPYVLTVDPLPESRSRTREYWPFYSEGTLREAFPIVHKIDAALWNVYLQEAARRSGMQWPHPDCSSPDSARRLPCEMVTVGALEFVNRVQQRIFNTNQIERIWPEDYGHFAERLWRRDDRTAMDVTRYGGLLLLRPLVRKFGVPRTLAYIAQTPFRVEHNNMHLSALEFQERALQSAL